MDCSLNKPQLVTLFRSFCRESEISNCFLFIVSFKYISRKMASKVISVTLVLLCQNLQDFPPNYWLCALFFNVFCDTVHFKLLCISGEIFIAGGLQEWPLWRVVRGSHEQGSASSSWLCSGHTTAHQASWSCFCRNISKKGEKTWNEQRKREQKHWETSERKPRSEKEEMLYDTENISAAHEKPMLNRKLHPMQSPN